MKVLPLFFLYFMLLQFCLEETFAQNSSSISLAAGFYQNILIPSKINNSQFNSHGYNIGVHFNRKLTDDKEFIFGLLFNSTNITDYKNQVNCFELSNIPVTLNTSISQYNLEIVYFIKKNKEHFFYGYGAILTYLLSTKLDQDVIGSYDSIELTDKLHARFDIHRIKYNAPFTSFNIAAAFNVGLKINEKVSLSYIISIDLIANPRNYFRIEPYNLIKNNILLTFKI